MVNKKKRATYKFAYYFLAIAGTCLLTSLLMDDSNAYALTADQKIKGATANTCFKMSLNSSVDYAIYNYDGSPGGWGVLMDGYGLELSLYKSGGSVSGSNCYNFLKDNYNGKSPDAYMSAAAFNSYMTSLGGYKQDASYESAGDNSGNKVCKVFNFNDSYGNVATSNTVCLTNVNTLNGTNTVTTSVEVTGNGPLNGLESGFWNGNKYSVKVCSSNWNDKGTKPEECKTVTIDSTMDRDAKSELNGLGTQLNSLGYSEICNNYSSQSNKECGKLQIADGDSTVSGGGRFIKQNGQSLEFVSTLLGTDVSSPEDLKLSKDEEKKIALEYLENFYDWGKSCGANATQEDGSIKITSNGETCYVWARKNKSAKVPWWASDIMNGTQSAYFKDVVALVQDVNNNNDDVEKCRTAGENRRKAFQNAIEHGACSDPNSSMCKSYKEKLKELEEISNSSNGNYTVTTNGVTTCAPLPAISGDGTTQEEGEFNQWESSGDQSDTEPGNTDDGTSVCFSAAGVLGWIVCPVIQAVGKAVDGLYENVVEKFLQIDASTMESGQPVHKAWGKFRDYANTVFAVAFIIVILSQITGIGISNYNIKKMLPRLLVVVVMVNASFFLCQMAVDLSNVLGYSLKRFFTNTLASGFDESTLGVGGIVSGIMGTLFGIAGGIGAGAALIATWDMWLIPFLVALVTAFIGIIFFFIVLEVRKAGVILLVALTPLAIVCYALPNTKSLFDKWRKAFTGLLLAYPICGLLMGGGAWLSSLLISNLNGEFGAESVFETLTAMLVQVVPFFFIPGIIRGSMTAMGNIGNRISGFGSNLSRQAGNSFRRSELARNMQHGIDGAAYNSVGALGRLKPVQAIANSPLGKWASGTKIGTWAGKRRATSRAMRKARLAGRYNFIEQQRMKAAAATGNKLLVPGSEEYDNEMRNLTKAQHKLDVASQETAYENGVIGADGSYVDINQEDTVAREYGIQMQRLQNEIASGADHTETLNKVEALQNILSGSDSGRNAIKNGMLEMAKNQVPNDKETSALSLAAAHLKANHFGTLKTSDRGMSKMVQDLASKDYSHIRTDHINSGSSGYRSEYYGKAGLAGYTPESFANADDGALDNIADGIENNEFSDAEIQTISNLANDALAANARGTLPIKEESKLRLQRLAQGVYTTGAVAAGQTDANGNDITSTTGSQAISNASMASLEFINSGLQSGAISGDTATRIAENARAALQDPAVIHDAERSEMLNQILTTANSKGINQLEQVAAFNPNKYEYKVSGNTIQAVDSSSIKVRGATRPPKLKMQEMPTGWVQNIDPINPGKRIWQKEVAGTWVNLNADELKTVNAINRVNRDRQRQNAINGYDYDVTVPTPPPAPNP